MAYSSTSVPPTVDSGGREGMEVIPCKHNPAPPFSFDVQTTNDYFLVFVLK